MCCQLFTDCLHCREVITIIFYTLMAMCMLHAPSPPMVAKELQINYTMADIGYNLSPSQDSRMEASLKSIFTVILMTF